MPQLEIKMKFNLIQFMKDYMELPKDVFILPQIEEKVEIPKAFTKNERQTTTILEDGTR